MSLNTISDHPNPFGTMFDKTPNPWFTVIETKTEPVSEPTFEQLFSVAINDSLDWDVRQSAQKKLSALLGLDKGEKQDVKAEGKDPEPEECAQACDATAPSEGRDVVFQCGDCEYPFLSRRIENQRKSIYDLTQKNERLALKVQELEQDIAHRNNVAKTVSASYERIARRMEETKKQRDELLKRVEELEAEKKKRGKTLSELLGESLRGTPSTPQPPAPGSPYPRPSFYYMMTPAP